MHRSLHSPLTHPLSRISATWVFGIRGNQPFSPKRSSLWFRHLLTILPEFLLRPEDFCSHACNPWKHLLFEACFSLNYFLYICYVLKILCALSASSPEAAAFVLLDGVFTLSLAFLQPLLSMFLALIVCIVRACRFCWYCLALPTYRHFFWPPPTQNQSLVTHTHGGSTWSL